MTSIKKVASKNSILGLLFLGWALGNLDRLTINYAVLGISKDLQLTASTTGIILSAFFIGYVIMQIPGGFLADRFGSRKVLVVIISIWSLFTALTGAAWSLASMVILRVLFGLAEGGFSPSSLKMITEVFPNKERGKAVSILLSSAGFMAILVPILATVLMKSIGWRMLFVCIGVIGFVVAILFWFFLKPPEAAVNVPAAQSGEKKAGITFKEILKNPMVWAIFVASFGLYTVTWGTASWIPTYLANVRHLDLTTLGLVAMAPGVAALIGMYLGGYLVDRLSQGAAKIMCSVCMVLAAATLYLMFSTPSLTIYVVYSFIGYLFTSVVTVTLPTILAKNLPSEVIGKASGFVNTGAQLAGFLTPTAMGIAVDAAKGSFLSAFEYMIVFALVSAVAVFFIREKKEEKMVTAVVPG
jgi:MFS transporter, ACS family, glucarate transporter